MSKILKFLARNKKAQMGVSTLIIFISAILTSAVAAAVIVRTVGIMQERAFTVTTEIRDRIVTAIDFISITGYSNVTAQKMYGIEAMIRTRSGSYPYSLLTAGLSYANDKVSASAKLQHTENEDYDFIITNLTVSSFSLPDLDKDRRGDDVRIVENGDGVNEVAVFSFSRGDSATVSLGADFSAGSAVVAMNDTPIIADSGKWYGFINANVSTGTLFISAAQNVSDYFRITHYPEIDYCDFSMLIPEEAYCYETRLGNDDTAVSKGEIYVIRFKLLPEDYQDPDEAFEITVIPKKGDFTSITGSSPDSFTRDMGQIWPTSS